MPPVRKQSSVDGLGVQDDYVQLSLRCHLCWSRTCMISEILDAPDLSLSTLHAGFAVLKGLHASGTCSAGMAYSEA